MKLPPSKCEKRSRLWQIETRKSFLDSRKKLDKDQREDRGMSAKHRKQLKEAQPVAEIFPLPR